MSAFTPFICINILFCCLATNRPIIVRVFAQMYYFNCINPDNSLAISETQIAKNLQAIVADADKISVGEVCQLSMFPILVT
jgi:hypothetical protein